MVDYTVELSNLMTDLKGIISIYEFIELKANKWIQS